MTKQEVVGVYLRMFNLKITEGDTSSVLPVIPFFLVNMGLNASAGYLKPKLHTQRKKQVARMVYDSLHKFIDPFFGCYSDDTELSIAVGEMVCDFEDFIEKDAQIFRVQIANFMFGFDIPTKKMLIDLYFTESMVKAAQTLYELAYREEDPCLMVALNALPTFSDLCKPKGIPYTDANQEQLDLAVNVLAKKIIKYLTL